MTPHSDDCHVLLSGRCLMNSTRLRTVTLIALVVGATRAGAQAPDPAVRLRQVLPPDVAARVIARAEQATQQHLPGRALEERALKFAARGVSSAAIEKAVTEQAQRMTQAQVVLRGARADAPSKDEIDAGAEALREGVDAASVAALARSAPSGRSLSVPLLVVGDLTTRGLPADQALETVLARLKARATDADLERLPDESSAAADAQHAANRNTGAAGEHSPAEHPVMRPMPRVSHPVMHRPGRP